MSDENGFNVHEANFEPPRRGRTPLSTPYSLIDAAAKAEGRWVSKSYPENIAQSLVRQIKSKYDSNLVEVASLRNGSSRDVYVRVWTTKEDQA
jgi:hypothetical protein